MLQQLHAAMEWNGYSPLCLGCAAVHTCLSIGYISMVVVRTQKAEPTDLPCFVRWPLRRDVGEEFALKRAVNARCLEHRALVDLRQQLTAQTLRWVSVHARAALRTHRAVTGGRAAAAQLNAAKGRTGFHYSYAAHSVL